MKYLITGASGFIGSHLAKHFPKRNVICIPHKDLYDSKAIQKYLTLDVTYIFHCASYGNMANHTDIDQTVKANVVTTHNLLQATRDIPYRSFIYLSSSSVYGHKNKPMKETDELEATDYYGLSKMAAELLVKAFVNKTSKPVVIARPFSVYGPHEASFRFIPTCIRALKGESMKIAHGMHDWIYIKDFIDGLLYIQEQAYELKGKAVNIGTGTQYDNYEILHLLSDIAKKNIEKLPIQHIHEMRSVKNWVADNTVLRSLGWAYKYSLREGLKETYEATQ